MIRLAALPNIVWMEGANCPSDLPGGRLRSPPGVLCTHPAEPPVYASYRQLRETVERVKRGGDVALLFAPGEPRVGVPATREQIRVSRQRIEQRDGAGLVVLLQLQSVGVGQDLGAGRRGTGERLIERLRQAGTARGALAPRPSHEASLAHERAEARLVANRIEDRLQSRRDNRERALLKSALQPG